MSTWGNIFDKLDNHELSYKSSRGGGEWERVSWDEVLDDIAGRIRKAILEKYADIVADIYKDDGSDVFKDVKEDEQPDEEIISQLAS